MPINFPVPLYLRTESEGNNANGEPVRRMSGLSPGTTDNTATTLPAPSLLAVSRGYLIGQQEARASAYSGAGTYRNIGWAMTPAQFAASGIIPTASDGLKFEAGTWTVPVHYSRPGGLLTGNSNITLRLNLYRTSGPTGSPLQHIGEGQASFTTGTSEASTNVNVSGAAATFEPGDCLFIEIWMESAAGVGDITLIHTNSTTGTRVSAAPQYSKIVTTAGAAASAGAAAALAQQVQGAVASSTGVGTVAAVAAQAQAVVGEAAGVGTVAAVTAQAQAVVGEAAGAGFPEGQFALVLPVVAGSTGAADAAAVVAQTQAVFGTSAGVATADGDVANIQAVLASADGAGQAQAVGGVVAGTVASSAGIADASGRAAKVIGTVGSIQPEPYPDGLLRLRPDGRVEAVRSGAGPLPPGALQRVVALP